MTAYVAAGSIFAALAAARSRSSSVASLDADSPRRLPLDADDEWKCRKLMQLRCESVQSVCRSNVLSHAKRLRLGQNAMSSDEMQALAKL